MSSVGMLEFNPELQRNLWLELTLARIIAAPIVLFVLLGGVGWVFGADAAGKVAVPLLWALLSLWGSRLAAESFGEEATGRTWDVQRLSAQGAWGLTLGKLAGGTAFAWYGALISALILLLLGTENVGERMANAARAGLMAQSTALFVVLLLHRFDPRGRRAQTTLAQLAGIVAGWNSNVLSLPIDAPQFMTATTLDWYGLNLPARPFLTAIQLAAIAWFVFGSMRLVRCELGHRDGPLGWTLYTLYTMLLLQGFAAGAVNTAIGMVGIPRWMNLPAVALGVQSLVAVVAFTLAYLAAFGTPVSRVGFAKLRSAIATRDWTEIWRNLPVWAPSAAAATGAAIYLSMRLASSAFSEPAPQTPIAALGFLFRDIALITLLRLAYRRRTAVALLVMFAILYLLLPVLLTGLGGGMFGTFVYPGRHPAPASALLPWLEAIAAWYFVRRRLRAPASGPAVQA